MSNDSTHGAYYAEVRRLDEDIQDGLAAIRAEQDEGRITPQQAAAERVTLLQRHLDELTRLRAEHLGGE
jgi:hypothetical protein